MRLLPLVGRTASRRTQKRKSTPCGPAFSGTRRDLTGPGAHHLHCFRGAESLRGAPLDFLGVTDHAFYMGVFHAMNDPEHELSKTEMASQIVHEEVDAIRAFTDEDGVGVAIGVSRDVTLRCSPPESARFSHGLR